MYLTDSFSLFFHDSTQNLWYEVQHVLKLVQTAACLEVVHSMIGLVKSPWVTALMQGSLLK
jgi:very-long-chain (3R)-3-hydroxyacyl-CoA dehydratase